VPWKRRRTGAWDRKRVRRRTGQAAWALSKVLANIMAHRGLWLG
jgi:hypothetical protein